MFIQFIDMFFGCRKSMLKPGILYRHSHLQTKKASGKQHSKSKFFQIAIVLWRSISKDDFDNSENTIKTSTSVFFRNHSLVIPTCLDWQKSAVTILEWNWYNQFEDENLSSSAYIVHTTAKQVTTCGRWNKKSCKMCKSEKQ